MNGRFAYDSSSEKRPASHVHIARRFFRRLPSKKGGFPGHERMDRSGGAKKNLDLRRAQEDEWCGTKAQVDRAHLRRFWAAPASLSAPGALRKRARSQGHGIQPRAAPGMGADRVPARAKGVTLE